MHSPSFATVTGAVLTVLVAGCSVGPDSEESSKSDQNGIATCPSGATVEGVDVSEFQGHIDWPQVKASGRGFAIARVADGTQHLDPTFAENWSGMKAAGIVRGVYQFFRPAVDGKAQANLLLSKVTLAPDDLPPVLDVEVTDGQSKATIDANIASWSDRIREATGRTPIIYTAPGFWDGVGGDFGAETLWVADWGVACPVTPTPWTSWKLWQYSDHGAVPGINAVVDLDRFNGSVDALAAFGGGADPAPYYRGITSDASGDGYWLVGADGGTFAFGGAAFEGSMGGKPLAAPVVGMAPTPSGNGYWLTASDGGIFGFGDAGFHGSMGGKELNQPVVGMASTPSGNGYWLVASDGGIFGFGDAGFHGSMGGKKLNQPVVGMASTPSGNGYWLVASDGGIFGFGDAGFYGSMGGKSLAAPVVGMASTPSGKGYWLVARDGGLFAFGDAGFYGSMGGKNLNGPIVGMSATPGGKGYWLVGGDGGVFTFGDAAFYGSRG